MKKVKSILAIAVLLCCITHMNAQEQRYMNVHLKNGTTTQVLVSEIDSIKFVSELPKEWVEINGVKWATRNVDMPGTFAANPEDAGMFYQWNRQLGWSSTDPMVNSNGDTTWDETPATGDTWAKANDPCPTGWRVPTKEELQSLANYFSVWTTTLNGVTGRVFGGCNNTLFLPAAGCRNDSTGERYHVGTYGYYWSSTPISTTDAYLLDFSSSYVYASNRINRANGFSVRCVAE